MLEIFGDARRETLKFETYNSEDTHYYWDDLGLEGMISDKEKYISCIRVHIRKHPDMSIWGKFNRRLFIKKKDYRDFKVDKYIYDENNSLWYELQSEYYLPCLTLPAKKEERHIGVWGRRQGESFFLPP